MGNPLNTIVGAVSSATPLGGIDAILDGASKIIGQFHTSPEDKIKWQEFQATLQANKDALAQQLTLAQTDVNKAEATSPNMFIAGWRPFIGWVCGVGLGYGVLVQPCATFIATLFHRTLDKAQLPALGMGTIIGLLIPMLGLGAYRTYEKTQGVAAQH